MNELLLQSNKDLGKLNSLYNQNLGVFTFYPNLKQKQQFVI